DVRRWHELAGADRHVAIRVKSFGVLSDDQEIHAWTDRRDSRVGPGRTQVREELEVLAQHPTRVELDALLRRVRHRVVGPENPSVAASEGFDGGLRERDAVSLD